MAQYEDDGSGVRSCPDCTAPEGESHSLWCANPEAPVNAGLYEDEIDA